MNADQKIIIIGGGVFGLSTALWLAKSGYKDVIVFDRCDFIASRYDPLKGCDGASADINKVFRTAYGTEKEYQDLALEAKEMWLNWNQAIRETPNDLPPGLTQEDELLIVCGSYFLAHGKQLCDFHKSSLDAMERDCPQSRERQFVKGNKRDEERLQMMGKKWVDNFHFVDRIADGETNGFLDIDGGITLANKACQYARFLCEKAGVKFVLGEPHGKVASLVTESHATTKKVTGIRTCDGQEHSADLVVVACGAWTASIIPEAHETVEATAGTLMFIDVPKERKDLWEKFDPQNCPVWSYRRGEGEDYYQGGGFPITKEGRLKFGFRGCKFTNFRNHPTQPHLRVSTPRTRYSQEPIDTVPLYGLKLMKEVIYQAFPELADVGFTDSRLCWYTDSIDNNYVIDFVPDYSDTLFICTGGSGHAFKFLPILGRHVKNQIERKHDLFTKLWKWRTKEDGQTNNGLSEGEIGPREMSRVVMATSSDFKFDEFISVHS